MKPAKKEIQSNLPKPPKPTKPKIRHFCSSCGNSFASLRSLGRHQRRENSHCHVDVGDTSAIDLLDAEHSAATLLASATPFFVNCLGRYQFNNNEHSHAINCPFCIVHKTSLQGLAKHCAVAHRPQYLAWKAGRYGKVQLRRVPPDEARARQVMQTLKDAGLLDRDIPMTEVTCPVDQPQAAKKMSKKSSKKRIQLDNSQSEATESWRELHAAVAMDTECLSPPLLSPAAHPFVPPPPPLIDCRSLVAAATAMSVAVADKKAPSSSSHRRNQKRHKREDREHHDSDHFFSHHHQHCRSYPAHQQQEFYGQYPPYYTGGEWGPPPPPPPPPTFDYADSYYHRTQFEQSDFALPPPRPQMNGYGYGYDHGQGTMTTGYYPPFESPSQLQQPPHQPPPHLPLPPPQLVCHY